MNSKKKILIIEDEPGQQMIYQIALERAGFEVVSFGEAPSGLQWMQSNRPDLILLDIMLPDISGLEVLHILRSAPESSDIPVVMVTASHSINEYHVEQYGISGFLRKPLFPQELSQLVKSILSED